MFQLVSQLIGVAPIESPFTRLQKPVKVVLFDTIKFAHRPLGLVPKVLNTIDVILSVGEQLCVLDAHVMNVRHIKCIAGLERVRVDNAVRPDIFRNDG